MDQSRTFFDNRTILHDDDLRSILDRRETMCNDDGGPSFRCPIEGFLHDTLTFRIQSTLECLMRLVHPVIPYTYRGFVEQENARISNEGTCNG